MIRSRLVVFDFRKVGLGFVTTGSMGPNLEKRFDFWVLGSSANDEGWQWHRRILALGGGFWVAMNILMNVHKIFERE